MNLRTQAMLFPTPSATVYGSSQNGINGKGGEFERPSANTPSLMTLAARGALPSHQGLTTSTDGAVSSKSSLVLNPQFVEMMMGFPIGWTDCEHSATRSFRRWLHLHSDFSTGNYVDEALPVPV